MQHSHEHSHKPPTTAPDPGPNIPVEPQPKWVFNVSGITDAKNTGKKLAILDAAFLAHPLLISFPSPIMDAKPAKAPAPIAMTRDFPS